MFEVGGCVRDELLGIKTKDIDFACEAESYSTMRSYLVEHGFTIFVETPEFLTIRAHFPKGWDHGMPQWGDMSRITADFVLCRKEGEYTDGRHPDEVTPGTILDDLARRDFTVNAIAKAPDGEYIDPHGGLNDLRAGLLRCVGSPSDRFREDALRSLRALRFRVTKGFRWSDSIRSAMASQWLPPLLASVSIERRREELLRALKMDTVQVIDILAHEVSREFFLTCFEGGLWLEPTLAK